MSRATCRSSRISARFPAPPWVIGTGRVAVSSRAFVFASISPVRGSRSHFWKPRIAFCVAGPKRPSSSPWIMYPSWISFCCSAFTSGSGGGSLNGGGSGTGTFGVCRLRKLIGFPVETPGNRAAAALPSSSSCTFFVPCTPGQRADELREAS